MICENCGARIYRNNKYGVCSSVDRPECNRIYQHRRYIDHHAEVREVTNGQYASNYHGRLIYVRLLGAKKRAAKKGVPFSLSLVDVPDIPEICPALGIPLVVGVGSARPDSPALDRIVPALGYVPGNVDWISHRANSIKSDATAEEIAAVLEYVRRRRCAS